MSRQIFRFAFACVALIAFVQVDSRAQQQKVEADDAPPPMRPARVAPPNDAKAQTIAPSSDPTQKVVDAKSKTNDAKPTNDVKSNAAASNAAPQQPNAAQQSSNSAVQDKSGKSDKTEQTNKDPKASLPPDVPDSARANRHQDMSEEEAAVVPYYNNFLSSYRLGPEDVISITVFNQPNYSKSGIIVPPDGRVSYYLIPEGIFVAGKTTQQVQEELTKKLDEYIIDPKVTVSLDKAQSSRFAVIGDVGQPGIRLMTRRLSVTEAIAEAGGVLPTGNRKKVVVLRRRQDNSIDAIAVNVDDIMRGKTPDAVFLVPGDQVFVPGNKLKTWQQIMGFTQVMTFARTFAPIP